MKRISILLAVLVITSSAGGCCCCGDWFRQPQPVACAPACPPPCPPPAVPCDPCTTAPVTYAPPPQW
jgi:hypothetical protein